MSTVNQVIQRVNRVKPNDFKFIDKVRWLSEVEGMVQTEVMLMAPQEIISYGSGDGKRELLVPAPWDKLYESYLAARIDFANGEYEQYANTQAMFNAHFQEFVRWFADIYRPADGRYMGKKWPGYFITAYGIAVKNGFTGSEAEWLESLRGPVGISPTVSVAKEGRITTITIKDVEGQHTAIVKDGEVTQEDLQAALEVKQDKLTFDDIPAENSANPVKSGGVWEGLRRKPNPNLLDNWYFVAPVNQRRLAECTAAGYTIDRWSCNCYEEYPLTIRENGVLLRGNRGFFQRIEPYKIEETETYTYSLLFADGSLKSVSFKFPDTRVREAHPLDGSGWVVAADGKGDGRYYQTAFYRSNGNTDAVVSAAKLELGDRQTLAHREGDRWVLNEIPDYGTELAKCQRYYQIFATEDRRPAEAEDFRPVMRVKPARGTIEINGRTYYTADANL